MNQNEFTNIQTRLQELFQLGEHSEAYELATSNCDLFPEQVHLLYYWRSTMAAHMNDTNLAIAILKEILDAGFWYGDALLRDSPSYETLQGVSAFEALVEQNRKLRESDQEQAYKILTIRPEGKCQAGGSPCPLFIGLHANGSNARASLEFWRSAASEGWLVAVPGSSQAMWKGAYIWNDLATSEKEIIKHYDSIIEQYAIDQTRIIFAGHSMGAEIAIWLILTGKVPAKSFIAIGPGGPLMEEPENWMPLIHGGADRGLSGYIIVGEQDETIPQEKIYEFVDMLHLNDIPCKLEVLPEVGHEYSPEYSQGLLRALDYFVN